FGAPALATLERIDDAVMLPVGIVKHVVHILEPRAVERERLRTCERDPPEALERLGEDRAARLRDDERVKARVHLGVCPLIALLEAALLEDRIAVLQAPAKLAQECLRGAALGDAAGGETLEHGAHIDRIADVRSGEAAHHIAAGLVHGEQPLVGEQRQRLSDRRTGHAEGARERCLRDTLTRGEPAAQDHLANADYGSRELGAHRRVIGGDMIRPGWPTGSQSVKLDPVCRPQRTLFRHAKMWAEARMREDDAGDTGEFIASLARGLAVLRAFTKERPELTLSQVAA